MTDILLTGISGVMGQNIVKISAETPGTNVVAGVDVRSSLTDIPVYEKFSDVKERPDVVIDFSHPSVLEAELTYCTTNRIPVVIAATGYNAEQADAIRKAAETIPVFYSANMSLGVNLMDALCRKAAAVLGDRFDIEIVEKHHNRKIDAPSGTALMLANGINETMNDRYTYVFDRHGRRQKRDQKEIGISSIRGGTIAGEHSVIFAGNQEVLEIKHEAFSREVFAVGALKAAEWIVGKPAGLYDMKNLI